MCVGPQIKPKIDLTFETQNMYKFPNPTCLPAMQRYFTWSPLLKPYPHGFFGEFSLGLKTFFPKDFDNFNLCKIEVHGIF